MICMGVMEFTGRLFKAAVGKYMAHRKEKKLQKARDGPVKPCGKQTVKQLIGQNQGVSTIESNDPEIKNFEKIARKYGVDYAVKKVKTDVKPKYVIFFKPFSAKTRFIQSFLKFHIQRVQVEISLTNGSGRQHIRYCCDEYAEKNELKPWQKKMVHPESRSPQNRCTA